MENTAEPSAGKAWTTFYNFVFSCPTNRQVAHGSRSLVVISMITTQLSRSGEPGEAAKRAEAERKAAHDHVKRWPAAMLVERAVAHVQMRCAGASSFSLRQV
jgi:hypothetical protein